MMTCHSSSVHDFTPEKGSSHYRINNEALVLSSNQVSILTPHGVSASIDESDIPFRQEASGKRYYFHAKCNDGEQRLPFVEQCLKVARAIVLSPSLRLVSTSEIDLQKHGSKFGMPSKTHATLVVLEVCGDPDVLEQLMSDGGFEKVPEHEESTFAVASRCCQPDHAFLVL
ncbi:hypothetical protein COOONC_04489 [Cooperia oncophora]